MPRRDRSAVERFPIGQQCRRFAGPRPRALASVRECRDIQQEADMTPRIPENFSTWLVDWSIVAVMSDTPPPRDPNDDDDAEDENDDAEQNDDREPAVIREPDPD